MPKKDIEQEELEAGFKKTADVIRVFSSSPQKNFTSAIIAAAGLSTRFGGDVTKQMTEICELPILLHTLLAYQNTECISEIIVVAKKDEIPVWEELIKKFCVPKVSKIVEGGKTRQESVRNGLDAVDSHSRYVAISDAARCLTTPEQIEEVCKKAYKKGAASAAHRATDTVKISAKGYVIDSTTDRNTVWLAQTPQVFKTSLYRAAAYTAYKDGYEATDDNSLVEYVGHPVYLVECGANNIKITTQNDLIVAEAIIKSRRGDNV